MGSNHIYHHLARLSNVRRGFLLSSQIEVSQVVRSRYYAADRAICSIPPYCSRPAEIVESLDQSASRTRNTGRGRGVQTRYQAYVFDVLD